MSNVKSIRTPPTLRSVLCVAAVLAVTAAARAQSDEMISLTIDTDGHVEDIPFDLDKPAAVSIQAFFPPAELGEIKFTVTDAEGKDIYKGASTGARYVSLDAGEYYLAFGPAGSSMQTEVELALYDPAGVVGDKGGFIAVGMKEGSAGLDQLMLIAETTGKALIETISPEIMKAELLEAVKKKPVETAKAEGPGGWITWLVILLILAASGGAGFWMRMRFKERSGGQAAATSTASGDPE